MPNDRKEFVKKFCDLTEYGQTEILSYSLHTGMFLTRNGGRYRMQDGQVNHIAGPSPDPTERV